MNRLVRLTQLIGLNSIPVVGIIYGGWSDPTALALYWCETVMLAVTVSARIHVHRRMTRKRGHFLEKRVRTTERGRTVSGVGHFGTSFFVFSIVLSVFNAMFLSWAVGEERMNAINGAQLKQGVLAAAALLILGFFIDMPGIRQRPFAWIRQMSTSVLWRVFLVQFAIILGVMGAQALDLPRATLLAFVGLKLYTDVVTQIPALASKADSEQRKRAAAEEERFTGRPIPFAHALIQRVDG